MGEERSAAEEIAKRWSQAPIQNLGGGLCSTSALGSAYGAYLS